MSDGGYVRDYAEGKNWQLYLGDSCEVLCELASDSVDLSVQSPPFASLFTYSPSLRDLGNSASREEFFEHYSYIIREQLRVTRPGRLSCIHVQQLTTTKSTDGYMGMTDFRGEVIRAFQAAGWIFNGEVTVWKNPQAQSIRTRSHALAFATKNRDSAGSRPALADYLLLFRKPGENPVRIKTDVTNDEWIEWAAPIWEDHHDGGWLTEDGHLCPVWYGIRETDTLNTKVAKDDADERHIAPLQLGFIERCLRLWSNPGELVLTPFAGIGSELYVAIKLGRRGVGIELKPSYWRTAVNNLTRLEQQLQQPSLFEADEASA
ncbi:DNA-methyltransferase [Mycobacterium ostraviense]|uniref:Methyltransferase n=1 Tax=Mycobacterium ostraviense TaxID=2738409 RepID=A0A164B3A7_9MYCO|nr:site-specific DNA-methyltransferase [Mycobacterium ostraviense]KZS63071.1 DNA methylase [Mycobacterium ostraviense]